jgi:hypothetical protein
MWLPLVLLLEFDEEWALWIEPHLVQALHYKLKWLCSHAAGCWSPTLIVALSAFRGSLHSFPFPCGMSYRKVQDPLGRLLQVGKW